MTEDTTTTTEATNEDVLVVVSKVKNYIRAKSEMNTSGAVAGQISAIVRKLCDEAIERAKSDNRKTVMDRDFAVSSTCCNSQT